MTFSEWSWQQCMVLGDKITAVKGEDGENIAWVNDRTGEKYELKEEK